MLKELPLEIIIEIARNLSFDCKFQLMLTCRALHRIIVENVLYEELQVMGGFFGPDIIKIIQKFKSKQLNGNQVKLLEIDLNKVPDDLYGQLPTIFPNVTEFINEQGNERKRPYTVVKFLKKWKDTIEAVMMSAGYTHLIKVLEKKNTTFSKLTRLRISPYIHTDFNMWKDDVNVINCLKNTPALKQLQLYEARVNIEFLEAVHANCPVLDVFVIENAIVLTTDDSLPTPLVPAEKMAYFCIEGDTVIYDDNGVFLDYIATKYPNMETLGFFISRTNRLVNHTVDPMDAKPRAMWLREDEDFPVIQTKQVDFKRTNTFYSNHGASKLISQLTSEMKYLSLDTSMFKNLDEVFSHSDIQLRSLGLMTTNKHGESISANVFTDNFEFLKRQKKLDSMMMKMSVSALKSAQLVCGCLKSLKLSIGGKGSEEDVELAWILEAFPSLEILTIESCSDTQIIAGETNGKTYDKLYKVKIQTNAAEDDVPPFVAAVAPNLKEFGWLIGEKLDADGNRVKVRKTSYRKGKGKKTRGKSNAQIEKERAEQEELQKIQDEKETNFHIDLTGADLDTLKLKTEFEVHYDRDTYIQTEIQTKDKKHTYIINPDEYGKRAWYYTSIKAVKNTKKKEMKTLSIICDSIKELHVDGKTIKL